MQEILLLGIVHVLSVRAAILPPPWADPVKNPCASRPGGWLLVYWPPDEKCYRIFHRGYPCPQTMELIPIGDGSGKIRGECMCPPRTARNSTSDVCFFINTKGPCKKGEYFSTLNHSSGNRPRIGQCVKIKACKSEDVFWPKTGQCFPKLSKGPCPEGQLIILDKETLLGECRCSSDRTFSNYYWPLTKTCHQHYTKGPCQEKGTLFLPGPECGCHPLLPNYHASTKSCYEIGTMGPCNSGHVFDLEPPKSRAECICKPEHVSWEDGKCYRLYTKGPCPPGEILFPNKTCNWNPCSKGKLFFPENGTCHRVGVEGPCPKGQLVLFEQSVRPSIDGVSFRGTCGFTGLKKWKEETGEKSELSRTSVESGFGELQVPYKLFKTFNVSSNDEFGRKIKICDKIEKPTVESCHALYSQGPCSRGEWLVPARQGRDEMQFHRHGRLDQHRSLPTLFDDSKKLRARCECRQGWAKSSTGTGCHLPLVTLAKFLNGDELFTR